MDESESDIVELAEIAELAAPDSDDESDEYCGCDIAELRQDFFTLNQQIQGLQGQINWVVKTVEDAFKAIASNPMLAGMFGMKGRKNV